MIWDFDDLPRHERQAHEMAMVGIDVGTYDSPETVQDVALAMYDESAERLALNICRLEAIRRADL